MTATLLSHPFFGLIATIAAYWAGCRIKAATKSPFANPLLIAAIILAAALSFSPAKLEYYRPGGAIITMFILPATVVLALQINKQWAAFRANALPVIGACAAGSVASIASIWLLSRAFGIPDTLTVSLLPKSVTTAIAIDLSEKSGGIPALTVTAVVITGMSGAILNPVLIKLLRLKNSVASGIGMGVSGHAIGTARALELGETEGAFSSIALCLAGIATSILYAIGG